MSRLGKFNNYLLSTTTSLFILCNLSGATNAQQIHHDSGAKTITGPIYTDTGSGGESIVSFGSGSTLTIQPLTGRISAGSALADGGGIIAYDTDFTGGARTGATVIARHQNTNGGAYIDLHNSTITTVKPNSPAHASRGLEARHSHTVTMTGGSITSRLINTLDPVGALTWSGSNKVTSTNTLAKIILTDVDINVSDIVNTTAGTGVASIDGGQIIVKGGSSIIVGHESNEGNKGIQSTGKAPAIRNELANTPSMVTIQDSTVVVHGDKSYGALLTGSGSMEALNTSFTLTGDASVGVDAASGSSATLNGSSIITSGENSIGLAMAGSSIAMLSETSINSQGMAVNITATGGGTSHLKIEGSALQGALGILKINSANADIFTKGVTASTQGDLLFASNGAEVQWNADNSTLSGHIIVNGTSNADIFFNNQTEFTGSIDQASLNIDNSSRWNLTNNSAIKLLNNSGIIAFSAISGDPAVSANYHKLTTNDYSANSGTIYLNTHLGDDTSATDQLIITGNTIGTTIVKVFNTGGLGAQTSEGIELILASNSSADAFTLSGDYSMNGHQAVVGGAYAYRLYQGNTSGSNSEDWFLRSELKDGAPEFQAGVPVYEAYSQTLLGLNGVATLQQRIGSRVWSGDGNNMISQGADVIGNPIAIPSEAATAIEGNGIWARIEGARNHMEPRTSSTNTEYAQNVFKLQAGLDGILTEVENGKIIGGVFAQYVHGSTKTKSNDYADGKISTDGYGFGGTLTWYKDNGFYTDAQAQATWYRSDLSTTAFGAPVLNDGNHGFGYTLSVEMGKQLALDTAWSVTPQVQLIYSNVKFDNFTDAFDADVHHDKGKSLQGRLGLSLDRQRSWQNANGFMNRNNLYGLANIYYEFMNGTQVDVAGVSFANKNDRLWGGVGLGNSYNWENDKYSIYGEGLINTSLNNFGDSYSVKGNLGFRMKW